ncbi:MAG TPA: NAD(P)H-dependent oxidoreductase subunit E, partial [Nitrososphaera sp.]|nr:NAD(P)H-dependent oxidoreductase subunit E [Nitrososphaera sp.]
MHPIETHAEGIFEELKAIQQKLTYLPEEELRKVAERRNLQVKDVREIAAFYHQFRLEPPATVDVGICDDMACHLRGALELRQRMEQRLRNVSAKDLTFRNVSCLGRCDQAPAFVINDRYYNGRSSDK